MNVEGQSAIQDTEFNAILREKGILHALPKPKEETPPPSPENQKRELVREMSYARLTEELENLEDRGVDNTDDTKFFELYRQKRLDEMREAARKAKFGSYGEVTKHDWTQSVNNAGEGVNERCAVVDEHLRTLAARYPAVKFLRGEASLCVPDFPDSNLPTIIAYCDGNVKVQYVGSKALGGHPCSISDLERRLAKAGAITFAETNEDGGNHRAKGWGGVTRIRTGGRFQCKKTSDSESD
ncbi:hypothetical protein TcWFU_004466 [Taenia crassiceps]|uniref:Uncharacterized protein n=1 Tax=Taenia crassiceps TaxID=6207 RepID=A0ABR4Q4G3_9CEST